MVLVAVSRPTSLLRNSPNSSSLEILGLVSGTWMGQTTSRAEDVKPSSSAQCPIQHNQLPAQCPVQETVSPLNQMPSLSQSRAPNQSVLLPTERTISSIPRPPSPQDNLSRNWDYPSPQQFYNALVRKGWETPEEHIETMVDIHNFLNEKAWEEVLQWEQKRDSAPKDEVPELARFMGRPGELSPKARFYLFAGRMFPSRFNTEPPFDRHDWVIRRPSTKEEVRYVIDYYSAPPEKDGSPVFSLDVRPALDSWGSTKERIRAATEDVWRALREKDASSSNHNDSRRS